MVLAFGEIMLPALPPPDSATSSATWKYGSVHQLLVQLALQSKLQPG